MIDRRPFATRTIAGAALFALACGGAFSRRPPGPAVVSTAPTTDVSSGAATAPNAVSIPVVVEPSSGFRVALPPGPSSPVHGAGFSADGKTLGVDRGAGGYAEWYDLATGARVDAPPIVEPAPVVPSVATQEGSDVTLKVGAAERRTLAVVAKEIGATLSDVDDAVAMSLPDGTIGTDGSRFVWFDGERGKTLVRLDTGARKTFRPWTNGFSGMGYRTGGTVFFAFGPDIDRAVVGSWRQMGATFGMDDPRLLDTRTMTELGALPGTCQPGDFSWSARGAFIARRECWTGRLTVTDGRTGAHLHDDEPFELLAFSADESLVMGLTLDGGLLVERTRSGEHVLRVPGPNRAAVTDVLFSRDGKRLIVARGSGIDVWDLEIGAGRVLDTRSALLDVLTMDAEATAAWIDGRWVVVGGAAPTGLPPATTSMGAFDAQKLASPNEGFEVGVVLPRPGTKEVFIAGRRTQTVAVAETGGTLGLGKRFGVVDLASGAVEHVYDDETLDERDWAWTTDGAHLVTRANGALAILSADLRLEPSARPAALHPTQPIRRLVEMFGTADGVTRAGELLSATTVAPIEAPRAIHPSTRFVAFAVESVVVVVDRTTGARLQLSCAEIGATRGCLATTDDGRFSASASIAPLVVRAGEAREDTDLVKKFFAAEV